MDVSSKFMVQNLQERQLWLSMPLEKRKNKEDADTENAELTEATENSPAKDTEKLKEKGIKDTEKARGIKPDIAPKKQRQNKSTMEEDINKEDGTDKEKSDDHRSTDTKKQIGAKTHSDEEKSVTVTCNNVQTQYDSTDAAHLWKTHIEMNNNISRTQASKIEKEQKQEKIGKGDNYAESAPMVQRTKIEMSKNFEEKTM